MHILVIGAGTAGMPLAIEAAEAGAAVTVIDKAHRAGGTLYWSTGQLAAGGTSFQRAAGIDDSPEAHEADAWRIGHQRADPVVLRRLTQRAPSTIEWLRDLGMRFSDYTPHQTGHEPYTVKRSHTGEKEGVSILDAVLPAFQARVDSGAIAFRLNTRAARLIRDGDRVVGVETDTGERLLADAVVLATGGYAANPDRMAAAGPAASASLIAAAPTSTGDGLAMALDVGGEWVKRDLFLAAEGGVEDAARPGRTIDAVYPTLNPKLRPPVEIWVNAHGRRFIAEDEPSPYAREHALLDQPDAAMWILFDDATRGDAPPLVSAYAPDFRPYLAEEVRSLARDGSIFVMGETIDDLATVAGLPSLDGAVEEANRLADGATDPLGRRLPPRPIRTTPFYALACKPMIVSVVGGVRVTSSLEVCRPDGTAIPGLYAVGEVCGGGLLAGDNFVGGMAVTGAITLGRWLGRTLA